MKNAFFLLLLAFVLLNNMQAEETKYISGGTARQLALGGSPTNAFAIDYANVFINPAWAVMYSDFIYSELGYNFSGYSASQQTVGFTYAIWKGLSVGLSVGKQEGPAFAINSYGSQVSSNVARADDFVAGMNHLSNMVGFGSTAFTPATTPRPLQVYGALKLGGLMVGAAFYRAGWSSKSDYTAPGDATNTVDETSVGQTGFKVGTLLDMDLLVLDASVLLRVNSATAKTTPPPPAPGALSGNGEINATGTEFAINARLFMKFSDKFSFVPMARFSTFGYEPEVSYAVQPTQKLLSKPNKYSRTEVEFGAGANITVTGGKVFAGITLESISLKNEVTSFKNLPSSMVAPKDTGTQTTTYAASILSFPKVSLGAEFEVASWLTGRIGYFKAFSSLTTSTEAPSPAKKQEYTMTADFQFFPSYGTTSADQLLSVGLGFHFDRLSFDGYLCESWLARGPYIISGVGTAMFGVLSMSYNFN